MKRNGLMNSGVPLGGLGTGSVELRQDGYLHQWQVMNNRPWGSGPAVDAPPDSAFFALHVRHLGLHLPEGWGNYDRTAVLGLPVEYTSRFPLLGHFLNDPYHMPYLEHAESVESEVRFPFTRLQYTFEKQSSFPVQVDLEAFSPFIPLDAKNSGLPLAYFTFRVKNLTKNDIEVSLLGALRNLTGYTYLEQPSRMMFEQAPGLSWMELGRDGLPSGASDGGSLALAVLEEGQGANSYVFHPRTSRDLWDPFHDSGRLESMDMGDFAGALGNVGAEQRARLRRGMPVGALCRQVLLSAGAERSITFMLAWHFPNFIEMDYVEKKRAGQPTGHRYAVDFDSAAAVLRYAAAQRADLETRTRAFVDAYYNSSFPRWLLDAAAAQLTTLVKSSWWDRSGRFGIWEGLGCCGLQTTDITYYGSFPIIQFFPEIQYSQMRLTRDNMEVPGKVPHMMPGNFSTGDVDHRGRIDLIPQYILLVWRDVLWSGDMQHARAMWPSVKDALAYFASTDTDGDGLPNNTGPDQTYDQFPLKGTSAFVGFLYAASLRAAAELADLLGEPQFAAELRERLNASLEALDDQLWNGSYYDLSYDSATDTTNDGVMTDQINGDWFVRQTSGFGLLQYQNVHSSLLAVFNECASPQGYLANCAWPFGGGVSIGRHTSDQAGSPWSGVEYAAAAHLILIGLESQGLKVARDVWERYERAGLRFNHIECGANYYRALSSWAVYLALTGFACNAPAQELTLSVRRGATRFVINTPTAWGEFSVAEPVSVQTAGSAKADTRRTIALHLREGVLDIRVLRLKGLRQKWLQAESTVAALDGRALHIAQFERVDTTTLLTFDPPLKLTAGQALRIDFLISGAHGK